MDRGVVVSPGKFTAVRLPQSASVTAAARNLIDWADDPVTGPIVRSWPARVETPRATALGLRAEASFDDIVRAYLADERARP